MDDEYRDLDSGMMDDFGDDFDQLSPKKKALHGDDDDLLDDDMPHDEFDPEEAELLGFGGDFE